MSVKVHIILIFMTLFFFSIVHYGIKKSKLSIEIAVVWTMFALMLVVLSLFPSIMSVVSEVLGIKTVTNALFMGMIFILLCMVFYLCMKISKLEEFQKNMIQEYSIEKAKNEKKGDERV